MKKIAIVTAALIGLAGSAFAADAPNKIVYVDGKQVKPAKFTDTITTTGSIERSVADVDTYKGGVAWVHQLGNGFTFGLQGDTSQAQDTNKLKASVEAVGTYKLQVTDSVGVKVGVGVGERIDKVNFPYYAFYSGIDGKLTDDLTWNVISYRYRNAFDQSNDYESNQLGTGVSYKLTDSTAIQTKLYRNYDKDWNRTGDGVSVGLAVSF